MDKISQPLTITLTTCMLIILSLTACTNQAAATPAPTIASIFSLEQCAIQLVKEEYNMEESAIKVSRVSTNQVQVNASYDDTEFVKELVKHCKPGDEHIDTEVTQVIVIVDSKGDHCEVSKDNSIREWLAVICPTADSLLSTPTAKPTLECIGGTWSYGKNVQSKIEIDPALKITIVRFAPDVIHRTSYGSTVTIYGDGRVVSATESRQASGSTVKNTVEKQITKDQLQQIVTVLEEANFYAITTGCGDMIIEAKDAPTLDISVETEGKVHEIKDNSACAVYNYDKYCDLGDKIDAILGTLW